MIEITRRAHFCAGHQLHSPALSTEENEAVYGCCHHPHGHNYCLEVTLRGEVDERTGMVMNLTELKDVMDREIIAKVDHRNLNTDVPFLEGAPVTAEKLAIAFWRVLEGHLPAGLLHAVRVYETPDNYVTYRGPER